MKIPSYPRLYHGTSSCRLREIAAKGIQPRAKHSVSNWSHTSPSRKDAVYLTIAYPMYFAQQATKDDRDLLAIFEIDSEVLRRHGKLIADEDAIEQVYRSADDLPKDWSVKRRTIYYRSRSHHYTPEASLSVIGNCAFVGTIPPSVIIRVLLMEIKKCARLVIFGADPTISVQAFTLPFLQEKYLSFTRWLFDYLPECPLGHQITREGMYLFTDVSDAVQFLDTRESSGASSEKAI